MLLPLRVQDVQPTGTPQSSPSVLAPPPPLLPPASPMHSYSLHKVGHPNPHYSNSYFNACIQISQNELCNAVYDPDSGKMLEFLHIIQKYPEI